MISFDVCGDSSSVLSGAKCFIKVAAAGTLAFGQVIENVLADFIDGLRCISVIMLRKK